MKSKRPKRTGDLIETRTLQFSVGLPGRQFRQLDQLAHEAGRTRSGYARDILSRHLAQVDRKAA
jgi:predicted DNA-binding protein